MASEKQPFDCDRFESDPDYAETTTEKIVKIVTAKPEKYPNIQLHNYDNFCAWIQPLGHSNVACIYSRTLRRGMVVRRVLLRIRKIFNASIYGQPCVGVYGDSDYSRWASNPMKTLYFRIPDMYELYPPDNIRPSKRPETQDDILLSNLYNQLYRF